VTLQRPVFRSPLRLPAPRLFRDRGFTATHTREPPRVLTARLRTRIFVSVPAAAARPPTHTPHPGRTLTRPAPIRSLILPAFLSLALLACTDRDGGGWGGEVTTLPGGARIVANPAHGTWDDDARWRVVADLSIGGGQDDGPETFGLVWAFDVDDDGTIYVFDTLARELRVFGPDGRFLERFGRRGGGPGEFEGVAGLRVEPAGAVWIVDAQNTRYTRYADGVATGFRRSSGTFRPPWTGGFTPDGTFHDLVATGDGEAFVRIDPDGAVRDTVPIPQVPLAVPRRGSTSLPLPFAPRHVRTFDDDGSVWTATSHDYVLTRTSLEGDTVLVISLPRHAPALTTAQRDSVARYADILRQELGVTVERDQFPDAGPLLDWIAPDDDGFVWVGLVDDDVVSSADVFDADGRYLGAVSLPFPLTQGIAPIIRAGMLLGVSADRLGAPVIVRGRVERGPAPR
jgi:hypothetical protein